MQVARGIIGNVSNLSKLRCWDANRWPDLVPENYACQHCGEFYWDPGFFDKAQSLARLIGPYKPNSAHRCDAHNAAEGGAPLSRHKLIAQDVSVRIRDPAELLRSAKQAGFRTFGYYATFLHMDDRPNPTFWYVGNGGKKTWTSVVSATP